MEQKNIPIQDLKIDGGTQPRFAIDEAIVSEYADAMKSGEAFPPVVVFNDGAAYWLADGFHRTHAARAAGIKAVQAEVHAGTRRDAILYSVGANSAHGLRRTNEDKRKAVMTLLQDEEWGQWADREIARRCFVNHVTVGNIRKQLSGENHQIDKPRKTLRGDSAYSMQTENIGRRRSGHRNDKTAPYEAKTDGQKVRCNSQKNKMVNMISTAVGLCRGLNELDVPMALTVCDKDEVATWVEMAKDISKTFRDFANKLQKGA